MRTFFTHPLITLFSIYVCVGVYFFWAGPGRPIVYASTVLSLYNNFNQNCTMLYIAMVAILADFVASTM